MRALGIIVNLFFPGIGTIIVGKPVSGVVQFILYAIAVGLVATGIGAIIGIPLGICVWIWAIVSAVTAEDKPLVVIVRDNPNSRPPEVAPLDIPQFASASAPGIQLERLVGCPVEGALVALLDGLLPALLLGAALEIEAFAGVARDAVEQRGRWRR